MWLIAFLMLASVAMGHTCDGDLNGDGETTVDEILRSVNAALYDCQPTPGPDTGHFRASKPVRIPWPPDTGCDQWTVGPFPILTSDSCDIRVTSSGVFTSDCFPTRNGFVDEPDWRYRFVIPGTAEPLPRCDEPRAEVEVLVEYGTGTLTAVYEMTVRDNDFACQVEGCGLRYRSTWTRLP